MLHAAARAHDAPKWGRKELSCDACRILPMELQLALFLRLGLQGVVQGGHQAVQGCAVHPHPAGGQPVRSVGARLAIPRLHPVTRPQPQLHPCMLWTVREALAWKIEPTPITRHEQAAPKRPH